MATAVAMTLRTVGVLLLAAGGLAAVPERVRAPEPALAHTSFTYRSSWSVLLELASNSRFGITFPVAAAWAGDGSELSPDGSDPAHDGARPTPSTFVPPPAPDDLVPIGRRLLTLRAPGWIPGLPTDPGAIELMRPRGLRTPPVDGVSAYLEVRVEGERGVNAGVSVDF